MSAPFIGIETGRRALRAAEAAMNTVGHNIANVNTPGYARQRAESYATDPYTTPSAENLLGALQIGTGAQVTRITQARDRGLDRQVRDSYAQSEAAVAQHDALSQIEGALGEPGQDGLNASLTRMFNAFHDLSVNAESGPVRASVTASAASVAAVFRQTASRIEDVAQGVSEQITRGVDEINSLAKGIANLNLEIRQVAANGDQPNDLRDRRTLLLDELSKKANTTVIEAADGTISVQIGGNVLVRGTQATSIAGIADLTTTGDLKGGALKGLVDAQSRVAAYQTDLEGLATTFRNQVNTLHQAGLDKNGDPGVAFFTGTGAGDLVVNPVVAGDSRRVAAAATPTPPAVFAVGNGENALALADLANKKITAGPISNQSLREYWGGTAATLGAEVAALASEIRGHEAFTGQLEARREAVSGVSLDEEMADMLKFQRAYQAAARLISISDELVGTLISAFGGRA